MKILIAALIMASATMSFAKDCEKDVYEQFVDQTKDYDYHVVSNKPVLYPAGVEGFESYGRYVELGYDFDVLAYHASNEMWGGYGAYQLIVDPENCRIIKMKTVYTE